MPDAPRLRVKNLPPLPAEMNVPYRAKPHEPGKLISFHPDKDQYYVVRGIHDLVLRTATMLGSTRMTMEEGDFDSLPAVLIVNNGLDWIDGERVRGKYGVVDEHAKDAFFNEKNPAAYQKLVFSDADFLSGVAYDITNNIYGVSVPLHHDAPIAFEKAMQAAKKYFDFVFVSWGQHNSFHDRLSERGVIDKAYVFLTSLGDSHSYPKETSIAPVVRRSSPDVMAQTIEQNPLFWIVEDDGRYETYNFEHEKEHMPNLLSQRVARDILLDESVTYPVPDCSSSAPKFKVMTRERRRRQSDECLNFILSELDNNNGPYKTYKLLKNTMAKKGSSAALLEMPKLLDSPHPAPSQQNAQPSSNAFPAPTATPRPLLNSKMLIQRLSRLADKWMSYELDPMKALDYPLMLDASCQETRSFLHSYDSLLVAKDIYEEEESNESLTTLQECLEEAELAFIAAENNAKKMRLAHLSLDDKKKVSKAKNLTSLALNESASPHERISAWKKAHDQLEGILFLPDAAVKGLLESGTTSDQE